MRNLKNINKWIFIAVVLAALSACKKEFLEKPPTDRLVDETFYKTDDQVLAGTGLLYSKVWFDYNETANYTIGDYRGGTTYSPWNDRAHVKFEVNGGTPENGRAWRSFFIVVAQSNMAIINIEKNAGPEVSSTVKKHAIAEARFMRALAYRYLVMNWGEVPIITNNLTLLTDTTIRKNTVKSIWRFITAEMRAAAEDLTSEPLREGRLTKWAAEGMLARFYLSRSGVDGTGGTRKQEFLDSAKYYADRVIKNSGKALLSNYQNLFKFPYDNNSESLFSLQWTFVPGAWGIGNRMVAQISYSSDIDDAGWGGDKSATWWMLKQYDGFETIRRKGFEGQMYANTSQYDSLIVGRTLDQRLKATYMLPGTFYPEITKKEGSNVEKLTFPSSGGDNSYASIKKYVIGRSKEDLGGLGEAGNYPNDTYMMRLAEMYLIYADATLGNNTSTNDATAKEYFNKVHMRAGLPKFEDPLTFDVIFKEKLVEFAMEGMAWYELVNLHYYNPSKAYEIINNQDRGLFKITPDQMPNPTKWTINKTSWHSDRTAIAHAGNFLLPIPDAELSQSPNLLKPAVDY